MAEDGRTYETKLFYGGNGLPHDLCNHFTDPAGDLYLFFKIKKYWQLNEYHRDMIRQVRAILKDEAKRRERARLYADEPESLQGKQGLQGLDWNFVKVEDLSVTSLKMRKSTSAA